MCGNGAAHKINRDMRGRAVRETRGACAGTNCVVRGGAYSRGDKIVRQRGCKRNELQCVRRYRAQRAW